MQAGVHQRLERKSMERLDGMQTTGYGNFIKHGFGNNVNHHISLLAVHGNWGAWQPWSACSRTCAGGSQTASRSCDSPAPSDGGTHCSGQATKTQPCNTAVQCGGYIVHTIKSMMRGLVWKQVMCACVNNSKHFTFHVHLEELLQLLQ